LVTTLRNEVCKHKETENRIISKNFYYFQSRNIYVPFTTQTTNIFPRCLLWVWNLVFILREVRNLRVLDTSMVLRVVYGYKTEKATAWWRKLRRVASLFILLAISVRLIKTRRIHWARNVARMRRTALHRGIWLQRLRERASWKS
jgi:hypothetical protein